VVVGGGSFPEIFLLILGLMDERAAGVRIALVEQDIEVPAIHLRSREPLREDLQGMVRPRGRPIPGREAEVNDALLVRVVDVNVLRQEGRHSIGAGPPVRDPIEVGIDRLQAGVQLLAVAAMDVPSCRPIAILGRQCLRVLVRGQRARLRDHLVDLDSISHRSDPCLHPNLDC
jgi:hypothetical protein